MPVYHQMGHQSDNLLSEAGLSRYAGAILSPVNMEEQETKQLVASYWDHAGFEMIFDPQLYYPNSQREKLRGWSYFPQDVDTVDLSSEAWWSDLVDGLYDTLFAMRPDAVCSPVVVPKLYTAEHYCQSIAVAEKTADRMAGLDIEVIQSALVSLNELADYQRVMWLASLLTRSSLRRLYLVIVGDVQPRRELADPDQLKGAMLLISLCSDAGLEVIVSHSSSDLILWKAAGAWACATGKWWNTRRFTSTKWEEPGSGGGPAAYWLEESLLAPLRTSDVLRVEAAGLLSAASNANPYSAQILDVLHAKTGEPWMAKGWRQYLYWFADVEQRIAAGTTTAGELLKTAHRNWQTIEDRIIMEELANDGSWITAWRRALIEYQTPW